ncbi:MAG: hypothetical protein AAFP02_19475, partial [Bacteroidota bacterium]
MIDGPLDFFSETLTSGNPLEFEDTKKYPDRIKASIEKTGLNDAVRTAYGPINEEPMLPPINRKSIAAIIVG